MENYNIILTGIMGTNKKKIGTLVAQELSMGFVDVDSEIETREGLGVNNLYSKYGEWYLRDIESKIILDKSLLSDSVIVTSEGSVLGDNNIQNLRENSIIIHLKARPEAIIRNISKSNNRQPLVNENQLKKNINTLLESKSQYYSNNDYEIDVSDLTPEDAASLIVNTLHKKHDTR